MWLARAGASPGKWPTFIGWRTWDKEPTNHKGRDRMDSVTVQGWANDDWASQIPFWQDQYMLWPAATAPGSPGPRVVSPADMERAMCFPRWWTTPESGLKFPEAKPRQPQHSFKNLRRNAVSNAIAVPRLARLIEAALDAVQ